MKKTVVIFVDHKQRDLPGAALIAHHLETKFNIRCVLEPLQSWKSCLAAYKPDYMMFNHMMADHLIKFSHELRDIGIVVAVLLNEGIAYHKDYLEYVSCKYHNDAHIDQYFCWNSPHRDALLKVMGNDFKGEIHVVGIPRFDYYFKPWQRVFQTQNMKQSFNKARKKVLFCTNFVFAFLKEHPKSFADKIFGQWAKAMPVYASYWDAIKINYEDRLRFFDFVTAALFHEDWDIVIKPHPRENIQIYKDWHSKLTAKVKERVTLRLTEPIWEVLPQCDVHIACETCTTSIEAWLCGKPSIELVFSKQPLFYHEEFAVNNPLCSSPEQLSSMIIEALTHPEQRNYSEFRKRHLAKWCNSPSGESSLKVASIIAETLNKRKKPTFKLSVDYYRKALKLKLKNIFDMPYGHNPFIFRDWEKVAQSKNIRPSDVHVWREKLKKVLVD